MESAVETQIRGGTPIESAALDRRTSWIFFALLAAYSLTIGDYSHVSLWLISTGVLLLAAFYLIFRRPPVFQWSLPFLCTFAMSLYGVGQTLWSNQKIVAAGWEKTLYWFTAAMIAFLATQLFRGRRLAQQFRAALIVFGGAMALLDVLEQASQTSKYFWLFPTGFGGAYGTFAYNNNFAQFIELTLPVTLWQGLRVREGRVLYLLLSALQIGAVVSSGSRAGSALVLAELIAVLILAFFKNRQAISFSVIGLALLLSLGFTYLAGFDRVLAKLNRPDQLAARGQINQASLAMIKARPLTGWGLGSYVPVYKAFALYDDGTWVNQAHNDYLEWAAEGGIPFACIMLVLIVWSVRPSLTSIWGVGLLAMCLHATVDYPFARLGTCCWYFALAGMLAAHKADGSDPESHRQQRAPSSR